MREQLHPVFLASRTLLFIQVPPPQAFNIILIISNPPFLEQQTNSKIQTLPAQAFEQNDNFNCRCSLKNSATTQKSLRNTSKRKIQWTKHMLDFLFWKILIPTECSNIFSWANCYMQMSFNFYMHLNTPMFVISGGSDCTCVRKWGSDQISKSHQRDSHQISETDR